MRSGSVAGSRYIDASVSTARAGEFLAALAYADSALAVGADKSEVQFQRGRILFELGRLDDAELAYLEVTESAPNQVGVWHNLGNISYRRNQFREALKRYRREHEVAPAARPLHALGGTYWELGVSDSARAAYREAIELDDAYAPAHFSLAELLEADGAYEDALSHIERALELDSGNPKYMQKASEVLIAIGEHERAIALLQRVLEKQPWNHAATYSLGRAQLNAGNADGSEAIARSERLREMHSAIMLAESYAVENPTSFTRQIAYADLLRNAGRLPDALRAYQKSAALRPADLNVQNNIATLFARMGQAGRAESIYRGILNADSAHAEAWLNVALLKFNAGDNAAGARALAAAERHANGRASILDAVKRVRRSQSD